MFVLYSQLYQINYPHVSLMMLLCIVLVRTLLLFSIHILYCLIRCRLMSLDAKLGRRSRACLFRIHSGIYVSFEKIIKFLNRNALIVIGKWENMNPQQLVETYFNHPNCIGHEPCIMHGRRETVQRERRSEITRHGG